MIYRFSVLLAILGALVHGASGRPGDGCTTLGTYLHPDSKVTVSDHCRNGVGSVKQVDDNRICVLQCQHGRVMLNGRKSEKLEMRCQGGTFFKDKAFAQNSSDLRSIQCEHEDLNTAPAPFEAVKGELHDVPEKRVPVSGNADRDHHIHMNMHFGGGHNQRRTRRAAGNKRLDRERDILPVRAGVPKHAKKAKNEGVFSSTVIALIAFGGVAAITILLCVVVLCARGRRPKRSAAQPTVVVVGGGAAPPAPPHQTVVNVAGQAAPPPPYPGQTPC